MSDPRVPHLLGDDADPEGSSSLVRAALRGARADVPDAAHMEALSGAIKGAITGGGGGAPGGSEPSAGPGPAAAAGAGKLAVGGLAVVVAGGLAFLAFRGGAPLEPSRDATPSGSAASSATTVGAASTTPSASAETVVDVHALPSAVAPIAAAARPAVDGTARAASSPDAEMGLLRSAQDALVSAPESALARCEEHATTYPRGALADEREVIAVDALLRLGRVREAEARAMRFRAAHPGSAYLRRLDTLLGRSD